MAVEIEISDEEYGVLLRGAEKRSISMKEMCGNMVSIFLGGYMLDKEPRPRKNIFETMKSDYDFFIFLYVINPMTQKFKIRKRGNLIKLVKYTPWRVPEE